MTKYNNDGHITKNSILNEHHLIYSFDCLVNHFDKYHKIRVNFNHDQHFPLFLTWNTNYGNCISDNDFRLRGCIGTFNQIDLKSGLKNYSLISALNDRRFSPIESDEISHLQCTISLLKNFKTKSHYNDFTIGLEGIHIKYFINGKHYSATYLPHVMVEQNWNKFQSIKSLIRKSGYKGVINDDLLHSIILETYETETLSMNYDEFVKYI